MLQIDRIGANFHILKGGMRTRLVDARGKVYFSWGAISDRENARQSACRVRAGEWDSGWIQREQMWIQYGGAPLLGLNGCVVKAHGSSNARAIESAIGQAIRFVDGNLVETLRGQIEKSADPACAES